jgi:NADPH-dependent ferric siderophore reductase
MQEKVMARHPSRRIRNEIAFRKLQVQSIEQLTPCMTRIALAGEELQGFRSDSPDDHVKLFFPNDDGQLVFPTIGANGPEYPHGTKPSPMRDFTPRHHDRGGRRLVLDFVSHDSGPAARWAAQAQIGQTLGVGGPRGSYIVANDFDHYVLIGDETALPAIGRWLEARHHDAPLTALIEIPSDADRQSLELAAHVRVAWLSRRGRHAATSDALERALSSLPTPAGDTFYWIAAESRRVRAMHRWLVEERGVSKEWIRATGYWQADPAQHK